MGEIFEWSSRAARATKGMDDGLVGGAGIDAELDLLDGPVDEVNGIGAMATLVAFGSLKFGFGSLKSREGVLHVGLISAGGLGEEPGGSEDGGQDDDREELSFHRRG